MPAASLVLAVALILRTRNPNLLTPLNHMVLQRHQRRDDNRRPGLKLTTR